LMSKKKMCVRRIFGEWFREKIPKISPCRNFFGIEYMKQGN
jgi:hypothetical protein